MQTEPERDEVKNESEIIEQELRKLIFFLLKKLF